MDTIEYNFAWHIKPCYHTMFTVLGSRETYLVQFSIRLLFSIDYIDMSRFTSYRVQARVY
jgi:hypothetical protein